MYKLHFIVPISLAILCFLVTPLSKDNPYVIHAIVISIVTILSTFACLAFSISRRGLCLVLMTISLFEMISYRGTIYKMADLFLVSFPIEFLSVRPAKYQSERIKLSESDPSKYFLKPMDVYGICPSYLQKDLCPAPRQDLISSGVKELFELRQRSIQKSSDDPREALNPNKDNILSQVLGCHVHKIRMVGNVQYAINKKDAARMIMQGDIFNFPVIITNGALNTDRITTAIPVNHEIIVHNFSSNRIDLTVNNKTIFPSWMIYSDAFNHRWKVLINGVPKQIFIANNAFKAVQIEPGQHDVCFKFYKQSDLIYKIFMAMMVVLATGIITFVIWQIINEAKFSKN